MAEFADMGDPTQLYMAIEKAYCEDRWPDVLEQGQRLLNRLPVDELGMRQRLQLLLAHTYLYGFGNRAAAGELYRAVQESQAESALRQIAVQGLQQCDLPATPPAAPLAEPPATRPSEAGAVVTPVMPWLASPQTAQASLIPEVIDEKELIDVHQADPALAEEVEIKEILSGGETARAWEEDLALKDDQHLNDDLDLEDDLDLDDDPELLNSLMKVEIF